jgi:threonine-phosphate decarboxylase
MSKLDDQTQSEKFDAIAQLHGGYHRYGFVDHAYLYNCYFPPEAVFTQFKDQIHDLVVNFPVAQGALDVLVSKITGQPAERIVVGNGVSELIKIVSGSVSRKLIVPVPSFNEYANATAPGKVVEFPLEFPSFQLDVDKFAEQAISVNADVVVVVTPNNPTSLLIPRTDLIRLADRLKTHDCMLIIDESFMDFADHPAQTSMEQELGNYPNLAIFKSMGKAYGICGLRLGYLLSANLEFAEFVRKGVHIWNINGFAEEFLRILPAYKQEFIESCKQVRRDRDSLYQKFLNIEGMSVFKPDANFIFCRLPDDAASAPEITRKLFIEHNILIKDCVGKTQPDADRYLRIASRTEAENCSLVEALVDVIGQQSESDMNIQSNSPCRKIRNILVIACGPFDYLTLQQPSYRGRINFLFEEITTEPEDIFEFIDYIINKYKTQQLDGIIGTHDGPESLVAAILSREMGLHGMDPARAFICEHKYYSRQAQHKIVPWAVPEFHLIALNNIDQDDIFLPYPFFVKPVKSAFSMMAKSIDSFETLNAFLPRVRQHLSERIPAFNALLKKYTALELDANFLLAEQILDGVQVTVEGFSWNGKVSMMGITDSIMYPGTMSFERFEYPSKLPAPVQQRMVDIASALILEIGLDHAIFNIEMFYNQQTDAIHVIEINPRMSYQFSDLFEKVDGTNSYDLQLQISQGEQPEFIHGNGEYGVAASFVLRLFEDKIVTRAPLPGELRKVQARFPDARIIIKVSEGDRLSDLSQDEESYRYAIINLGGKDWADLHNRFEEIKGLLKFDFRPLLEIAVDNHMTITQDTTQDIGRQQGLLSKFKSVGFFDERELIIRTLRDFFEAVNKHQVRACIMFGTLLGKLRHNDFIPWDDDVDVIIFDYEGFLERCEPELARLGYTIEPDVRGGKRMGSRMYHYSGLSVPGQPQRRFPWIGIYEYEIGEDGLIVLPPETARYLPEDFLPLKQTDLLGITVGLPRDPIAVLNKNFGTDDWMEVCQLPYRDHRNGNIPAGFPDDKFELQSVLDYLSSETSAGREEVSSK